MFLFPQVMGKCFNRRQSMRMKLYLVLALRRKLQIVIAVMELL